MKKILLMLLLLGICYSAEASITWTKDWSSADDGVNTLGGGELEDIQDDLDSQLVTAATDLTFSSDTAFSGTSNFTGASTISNSNTFSGSINFSGGISIDATTAKVGVFSRDTGLGNGTQSVTGVGFKPRGIIFFTIQNGTSEVSWGMSDGTTDTCIFDRDALGDGTYEVSSPAYSIADLEVAGTYAGTVSSMDTNGFTITWLQAGVPMTGTIAVYYLAFAI
jgi:hypothetical protein